MTSLKTGRIEKIHKSPWQIVLAVTGGGSAVISDLLNVPGASKTVLEAIVPYSNESLNKYLGRTPEQYCSGLTARQLAVTAFFQGLKLSRMRKITGLTKGSGSSRDLDKVNRVIAEHFYQRKRTQNELNKQNKDNETESENIAIDEFIKEAKSKLENETKFFEPILSLEQVKRNCRCLLGVGVTAALASDRPKKGEHRIYLALQSFDRTIEFTLKLTKGVRSRLEEEAIASELILSAIENFINEDFRETGSAENFSQNMTASDLILSRSDFFLLPELKPYLLDGEKVQVQSVRAGTDWTSLLFGSIHHSEETSVDGILYKEGTFKSFSQQEVHQKLSDDTRLIFPGSFHPIHHGHTGMIRTAQDQYHLPVNLEISVRNVDKPPLDFLEILDRLNGIKRSSVAAVPVWFTRFPKFVDKAWFFQNQLFIVGTDTLVRIADPKYDGSWEQHRKVIENIVSYGTHFIHFNRRENGIVWGLNRLPIDDILLSICQEVSPECFVDDISSTSLRRNKIQEEKDGLTDQIE